jgi:hypothetical protein
MDQRVMDVFMRELDNQGDAVAVAWAQYRAAITALEDERPLNVRPNMARVFLAVQAILASGALVCRSCCGCRSRNVQKGATAHSITTRNR